VVGVEQDQFRALEVGRQQYVEVEKLAHLGDPGHAGVGRPV